MTVEEAMGQSNERPLTNGTIGNERSEWCDVGIVDINSGKLTVIDFRVLSAVDGVTVDVSRGQYLVQAKIMSFDGSLGVCRARALPVGLSTSPQAKPIGNVSVDVARIAIGDIVDASQNLTPEDRKTISKAMRPYSKTYGAIANIKLPSKEIKVACVSSGFGDGIYPVFSLTIGRKSVGVEIEFVKDGYVYDREAPALTKAALLSKLGSLQEMISKLKPPKP